MTRPKTPLPEPASTYIRHLAPTHKQSSLNGYRVTLRKLHRWLYDHDASLDQLTREHLCAWLRHLHDAGLVPKTLNHHIIFTRLYLRWLYERRLINGYPDELIRTADMLKEPKYLPRPLPPHTDRKLQQRLTEDGDIYALGLLLMRKTGIRNGELRALEVDCIRRDNLGNHFLKVPLGKLDSERLVPIDDDTLDLIGKLRGNDEKAADKVFLIETQNGKKTRYLHYQRKIKLTSEGLELGGPIGTHRLRHTFATSLLDAGMSLVGIMKLLGHTDHRMTLRYAEITQESVSKEYFEALARLEHRYAHILHCETPHDANPLKMLDDVVHLIQKLGSDNAPKAIVRSLVRRIQRIQATILSLFPNPANGS